MSKETPAKKEIVIAEGIKTLAGTITEGLTIDKKSGEVTFAEGLYEKTLPEGLTIDQVALVSKHNSDLAAATLLAVGEAAIPVMKKVASIERVEFRLPTVDKDGIKGVLKRSQQVTAFGDDNKPNGTKPKFGATTIEYEMYGTGPRGQMSKVKDLLTETATKAFS